MADAAGPWDRRRPPGVLTRCRVRAEVPRGHRRPRRGRGAQRAVGRVRGRVAGAAAARRPLHRDGKDGRPRRRPDGERARRRLLPRVRPAGRGPGAHPGDAGRADAPVRARSAPPAADRDMERAPWGRGVPSPQGGPARGQGRAHRAAAVRPGRDGAGHRRHGRPGCSSCASPRIRAWRASSAAGQPPRSRGRRRRGARGGAGRAGLHGQDRRVRRRRPRPAGRADRIDPGGAPADRRDTRGGGARRRRDRVAGCRAGGACHAPEGRRGAQPARPDRPVAGRVRAVLLGRREHRQLRPGQLRGGERLPRRARAAPRRRWAGGHVARLGAVGRLDRDDRRSGRGRRRALAPLRDRRPDERAGAGAVRRGAPDGRAVAGARAPRHGRAARPGAYRGAAGAAARGRAGAGAA